MKNKRFYFKILIGVLVFCAAMTTWGCKYVHTAYDKRDKTRAYVVYEAIFVDNEQVKDIFAEIRGEAPYPIVTQDFHVTTAFLPETDARFLYGKKIQVHIVGYKAGEVTDDDGDPTHNEGLKVELYSEDEEMNAYLTEHPANYHITGSYEKLAKYTGYVDFSDGKPVDRTITGTFGAYLNGAKIAFDGAEVDKKL